MLVMGVIVLLALWAAVTCVVVCLCIGAGRADRDVQLVTRRRRVSERRFAAPRVTA